MVQVPAGDYRTQLLAKWVQGLIRLEDVATKKRVFQQAVQMLLQQRLAGLLCIADREFYLSSTFISIVSRLGLRERNYDLHL